MRCYYKLCAQDLLNEMVFCSYMKRLTSTYPANFSMLPENRGKKIARFLIQDKQKYVWQFETTENYNEGNKQHE